MRHRVISPPNDWLIKRGKVRKTIWLTILLFAPALHAQTRTFCSLDASCAWTGGHTWSMLGVFTNSQMNQPYVFNLNNLNFQAMYGAGNGVTSAVAGGVLVPVGNNVSLAAGVSGWCESLSLAVNCVPFYGVGRAGTDSETVWGINVVSSDTDLNGVAHLLDSIYGNEIDIGCSVTSTICTGVDVQPVLAASPTVGRYEHYIKPISTGGPTFIMPFGLQIDDGAATVAISVGAQAASASQSSSLINLVSRNSGNAPLTGNIQQDALGNINIASPGGTLNVSSGAGALSAGKITSNAVLVSGGTGAALTGTGACVTVGTQKGGAFAGQATCTGSTGASTFIITPGSTSPNGWSCSASDLTTAANILRQSVVSQTSCTIAGTVNGSDVLTFLAVAY